MLQDIQRFYNTGKWRTEKWLTCRVIGGMLGFGAEVWVAC